MAVESVFIAGWICTCENNLTLYLDHWNSKEFCSRA